MIKEKSTKHIVIGTKKFRYSSKSFVVNADKRRSITSDNRGNYNITIDANKFKGKVVNVKNNNVEVVVNSNTYSFLIYDEKVYKRKKKNNLVNGGNNISQLRSPMPGKIIEVFASKGDVLKEGDPLLILEAMKMQNQVLASFDCKVITIHMKEGDAVMGDQLLFELKKK